MPDSPVVLDGSPLTFAEIERVARRGAAVRIGAQAEIALREARSVIESHLNDGEAHYGINTGFGSLSRVRIAVDQLRDVQRNLIRSHAAGVGDPLPDETVRAMLLILAGSLCRGRSGVRVELVGAIIDLLNHGVTPRVPSRGSVGASGDLAPLAHAALVLIGEGSAVFNGSSVTGAEALAAARLKPITLEAKEGLALINGTHLMAAIGSLVLADTNRLIDASLVSAAMSIDACRATDSFLDERLHLARNQPGQRDAADRLRRLVHGSQILQAHKVDDPRVQDPYCLRAMPQVLGAVIDALGFVRGVFENELGGVTDNPLVFAEPGRKEAASPTIVSGGNFHGMPLAIALDLFRIALCHVAGIAERRINWLLTASDSENPVNPYLSPQPGLHSGLMIVQYTAAACCNEMQTLSHPASPHNITTSAGIEDYNSMGATAAHHARATAALAAQVIACELLVMTEAMEYQRPLRSGKGVERAIAAIREVVPRLTADRPPSPDIEQIAKLIGQGAFGAPARLES